jgi:tRNA (uracil-5-)-methyltransferase
MTCSSFGKCGSCTLWEYSYKEQLELKVDKIKKQFNINSLDVITSEEKNFRYRAEFRVYYDDNGLNYAMSGFDKKIVKIDECNIVSKSLTVLMEKLLKEVSKSKLLKKKLFAVEFLTTTTDETIITLIYHKKIDETWKEEAEKINIDANIIGRSRGVKIVIDKDYIFEKLNILGKSYIYKIFDSGFTQPNPKVNEKMISWVLKNLLSDRKDLLELYCGLGNFTLPLSTKFNKILATEVSKASIRSALENVELNNIENISFVRLSSQELVEALEEKREFNRLKDINLKEYNFSHIFIDPPRAGVDEKTIEFLKQFKNIIYISCNPDTLKRDLDRLDSYEIKKFACFDQFAYTNHLECGVILRRRDD